MLKARVVIFMVILSLSISAGYSQLAGCRVKMESISGKYTGECRKGLAHGKGSAEGTDSYTGGFRKGLPDGSGKYTWEGGDYYDGEWRNGLKHGEGKLVSGDSVLTGIWKDDVYMGKKLIAAYKVNKTLSVARYSVRKINTPVNEVKIKLIRGGIENSGIENLMIAYSSGFEYKSGGYTGIQNPSFPLDIKVTFSAWNIFRSAKSDVIFDLTINQPGNWDVVINY